MKRDNVSNILLSILCDDNTSVCTDNESNLSKYILNEKVIMLNI